MTLLSREEIIDLIQEIEQCKNKSEKEIDILVEKLRQGVLDPEITDYIFWGGGGATPEEIADKVLSYQPIVL